MIKPKISEAVHTLPALDPILEAGFRYYFVAIKQQLIKAIPHLAFALQYIEALRDARAENVQIYDVIDEIEDSAKIFQNKTQQQMNNLAIPYINHLEKLKHILSRYAKESLGTDKIITPNVTQKVENFVNNIIQRMKRY